MRICLVCATHVCQNPRLLREADSLAEAGYSVRVIARSLSRELDEQDKRLLETRSWRLDTVEAFAECYPGKVRFAYMRLFARIARVLGRRFSNIRLKEWGVFPGFEDLYRLALAEQADWYIAHAQPVLPIAARAAQYWKASLGFDCEDLLALCSGEPEDVIRAIETRYLSQCAYVTAASKHMARYLAETYSIVEPTVLYNVFPLEQASGLQDPRYREPLGGRKLRLHWFSKVIGSGRGIEDAIQAAGYLGDQVELHLRGIVRADYKDRLLTQARAGGLEKRIFFHPVVDHTEVIRGMDGFDVGLALEQPEERNYAGTVSNKFFSYLLAGLAVVATDVPGQREAMSCTPGVGFLYNPGDAKDLAKRLGTWIQEPGKLRDAQIRAWDFARSRFCWELEAQRFLELVGGRGAR